MKKIRHQFKMYLKMFQASIKSLAEYRVDFFVGLVSQLLYELIQIVFVIIVFQNTETIQGWNFYEVLLLCGLLNVSMGYVDFFFEEMYEVGPHYMKDGTFDILLLRPIHPLLSIMANSRSLTSLGNILLGLFLCGYSLFHLHIPITLSTILFLLFITFIGGMIIGAIITLLCVSSFWVWDSNEIMWSAFQFHRFAQYPLTIYNSIIKFILIVVTPFAFVSFFPASFLLGRDYGTLSFIAPIVALLFWVITIKMWNWGMKFYKSSGS